MYIYIFIYIILKGMPFNSQNFLKIFQNILRNSKSFSKVRNFEIKSGSFAIAS